MRSLFRFSAVALLLLGLTGCSHYTWKSAVPEDLRTVSVPVFENRTMAAELGPILSQYTLREFQREGTFKIRRSGDAALEVQASIVKATRGGLTYDRSLATRASNYRYVVTVEVSFVDKKNGRTLLERRPYVAETSFLVNDDLLTGQRNAAARIGQDLARQIVDDLTAWNFAEPDTAASASK